MIRILEGASASLKMNGAPFMFGSPNGVCAGSRANRKRIGSFPKIEKDAEKDKPCKKRRSDPL